jgi:hypothetical protein
MINQHEVPELITAPYGGLTEIAYLSWASRHVIKTSLEVTILFFTFSRVI